MTQTEIETAIKQAIRQIRPSTVIASAITQATEDARNILGQILGDACPEYWNKRVSLQSQRGSTGYTHVFDIPSDSISVKRVRDMGLNVPQISATADNGSGLIRVTTAAAHDLSDGDKIFIHGANTETNGNWELDYQSTTTFDLLGSTWSANPGAGFIVQESSDYTVINRTPLEESTNIDDGKYFLRNGTIVVDDYDFEYDILIDYYYYPTDLTDIPERFHIGLIAYGVIDQMRLPGKDTREFPDFEKELIKARSNWKLIRERAESFAPVIESINISDVPRIKRFI